ncbi:uncharacterized protein METZ01_LOCUS340090 [marine metagenome]|uniref:ACT-like domain-containing protein n=1 Tax=marine metagenome TaxID=408172 RepID=A0A382QP71_9ZZZZ
MHQAGGEQEPDPDPLVRGSAPEDVPSEIARHFEFPERPDSLLKFLDTLGDRWNISLSHYRNHEANFSRVLAGFEVSEEESEDFRAFMKSFGYPYVCEPDNTAYRLFLR